MTQVETNGTISPGEAVQRISNSSEVIKITTPNGVAYIRTPPEDDVRDGPLHVNLPLPFISERHTITGVDRDQVIKTIGRSDTAETISINDTPFSPLYDGEDE